MILHSVEEKACAKINLSLHVLGRRMDGYHSLSSVVAFADVADHLTIRRAADNSLVVGGPFAAQLPAGDDNLIWKAWRVLATLMPVFPVHVELEKNLPVASGIGGGSADAAAMLRGLLRLMGQSLSPGQIAGFATGIGADVPVCFYSKPCRFSGIGEIMEPFAGALPKALVLVNPLQACSTAEIFSKLALSPGENRVQNESDWHNALQIPAATLMPEIDVILGRLRETGLKAPRMSGSGATCFAEAEDYHSAATVAAMIARDKPSWWVKPARVLASQP